jgi:hypothetical protein
MLSISEISPTNRKTGPVSVLHLMVGQIKSVVVEDHARLATVFIGICILPGIGEASRAYPSGRQQTGRSTSNRLRAAGMVPGFVSFEGPYDILCEQFYLHHGKLFTK